MARLNDDLKRLLGNLPPGAKVTSVNLDAIAAAESRPVVLPRETSYGPRCPFCAGERCAVHGTKACGCDTADRHGEERCQQLIYDAPAVDARDALVPHLRGNDWTEFVVTYAQERGYLAISHRTAKLGGVWQTAFFGDKGFPDCVLVREKVMFIECKSGDARLTKEQKKWKQALTRAGAIWYEWRPEDWPFIKETLA